MNFHLKATKVACRPRLFLHEAAVLASDEVADAAPVELRGPWEGEVSEYRDHRGRLRLHVELVPLSESASIRTGPSEPVKAWPPMPLRDDADASEPLRS